MSKNGIHLAEDEETYIIRALQRVNSIWDRGVAVRVRVLALLSTLQKDDLGADECVVSILRTC